MIPTTLSFKSLGLKCIGKKLAEIFEMGDEYYVHSDGLFVRCMKRWSDPVGKFAEHVKSNVVYIHNVKHEVEWISCNKTRCSFKSLTTGEVMSMRSTQYFTLQPTDLPRLYKDNIVSQEPIGEIKIKSTMGGWHYGTGFKVIDKWGTVRYMLINKKGQRVYGKEYQPNIREMVDEKKIPNNFHI